MNPEWVEAGARALAKQSGHRNAADHAFAYAEDSLAVIAAVEPLIRADERERLVRTYDGSAAYAAIAAERDAAKARTVEWMDRYNAQVEAERQSITDLWAKVEALPHESFCSRTGNAKSRGECNCLKGRVLALQGEPAGCPCWDCRNERASKMEPHEGLMYMAGQMVVCEHCGNKRCPHATNHTLDCTNSNDTGQEGSRYA